VPGGVNAPSLGGGVADGLNLFLYVMLAAALIGVGYYFYVLRQFKHTAIIRKVASNGRRLIFTDKFRELKDKNGGLKYILLKMKRAFPPGEQESLEVRTDGKLFAEMYMSPEGSLTYTKDTLVSAAELTGKGKGAGLTPVSSNQRIFVVNELRKREERLTNSFWAKNGPMIVVGTFLVLIVGMVLIFGADFWRPFPETAAVLREASMNFKDASENYLTAAAIMKGSQGNTAEPQLEGPPR